MQSRTQLDDSAERLASAHRSYRALEGRVSEAASRHAAVQLELETARDSLLAEVTDLRRTAETAVSERDEDRRMRAAAESRLADSVASHAAERSALESARDVAVAEKKRMEGELQAARQARDDALNARREMADALELVTKDRDDSKAAAVQVTEELATVRAALVRAEQRASITTPSASVSGLQAELAASTAALNVSRTEVSRLRAEGLDHAVQLANLGGSAATRLLTLQTDLSTAIHECVSRAVADVRRLGTARSSSRDGGGSNDDDDEPDSKRLRTA